jgi:hypothetical protein
MFCICVSDVLHIGSSLPQNITKPGMQMLAIPPSSAGVGASSSCSVGTFHGKLAALSQYDRSIFSDMSLHDGILTTKWVEKEDNVRVEVGGSAVVETPEDKEKGEEMPVAEEKEDLVDDWARQYQESLNRKQLQESGGGVAKEEGGEGGGTEAIEEEEAEEYFEENYDYERDDEALQEGEGEEEEDSDEYMHEYKGHTDLYNSSFVSGSLLPPAPLSTNGLQVGSISAGEVQLQTLQQELETAGVVVEYKLGRAGAGAMLLCAGQVIIRKTNANDFVLEGPPCNAFNVAKRAVYKRFSFL